MVLSGTLPQADGYGNAVIDSDDSYSFSQNSLSSLRQFATRIEIPPYGIGKQLLFLRSQPSYEEYMASRIKQHIEIGMAFVDRSLTQQETDSFVEQAVSLTTKPRIGAYLGAFVGFLIVAKPFVKNGRLVPTSQIKSMVDRQLIVKALLWPFCVVAGNTFGKASGASLAVRDLTSDPRLNQYRQDRANQDPQKVQKTLEQLGWKTRRVQPTQRRPSPQHNMPVQDDNASPTAGFGSAGYGDSMYSSPQYGSSNESNGMQPHGDSQTLRQTNSQQWNSPQQQQQQQQQQGSWGINQQARQAVNKSDNEDVFDLTSNPTTPATSPTATPSQPPGSTGSAWDRLRRSSSSASAPSSTTNRGNSTFGSQTTSTENFSSDSSSSASSGSSWERIRSASAFPSSAPFHPQSEQWPQNQQDHHAESTRQSKDKAQREFDRLLEKERQTSGDGDGYTKPVGAWGRG
ncbi:hypothetical protein ACJ72_03348 [Emergomyces africanus]|uniref:Uncharacterized protein n=1 Tax=Emergomyces africanus TaxID=1955775 RepID=A0A1B7NZV8_9EURO|nr:hypothetical protein ACJ72_03348 [Emergomyces africanus]